MLFRVMAAKLQRRTETSRPRQAPGCGTWSVATVVMGVVVTLHTWKMGERDVCGCASLATTIPFRYVLVSMFCLYSHSLCAALQSDFGKGLIKF